MRSQTRRRLGPMLAARIRRRPAPGRCAECCASPRATSVAQPAGPTSVSRRRPALRTCGARVRPRQSGVGAAALAYAGRPSRCTARPRLLACDGGDASQRPGLRVTTAAAVCASASSCTPVLISPPSLLRCRWQHDPISSNPVSSPSQLGSLGDGSAALRRLASQVWRSAVNTLRKSDGLHLQRKKNWQVTIWSIVLPEIKL